MKYSTLLNLVLIFLISTLSSAAPPTDYLLSSCSATAYPTVCVRSLSTYAGSVPRNPRQLAHVALTVSAVRAREASSYVSRLSSTLRPNRPARPAAARGSSGPFRDCAAMMADGANQLRRSVGELGRLGRAGSPEFALCMSNIQTWVSAALTAESMCLNSLSQGAGGGSAAGRAAVAEIRKRVEEVSKITSNALSLVNKING